MPSRRVAGVGDQQAADSLGSRLAILDHYDMLLALSPSPVVELNAIVLAELRGPDQGLRTGSGWSLRRRLWQG